MQVTYIILRNNIGNEHINKFSKKLVTFQLFEVLGIRLSISINAFN